MPYWVVTSDMHRIGPYTTESKAEDVKDRLDCDAQVLKTESYQDAKAVQELRYQLIEQKGSGMGSRNFKRGEE